MLENELREIFFANQDKNPLFLRNLLKEALQFYVLNFIYNSQYAERFLMKGGTCLRFCFGLPRLSEDLDFDVYDFESFDYSQFLKDLKIYFINQIKYKELEVKISGKNKIIYLKFPILKKIGFPVDERKPSENILFLRIDLSAVQGKSFKTGISLKSSFSFSFIIKRYSIEDLFAGKIAAILSREAFEGKEKKPRFKGRDYFDIFWLQEKGVRLNLTYLNEIYPFSSKEELKGKIIKKFKEAEGKIKLLKEDLIPFFENQEFVENFVKNFSLLAKSFVERF